MLKHITDWLGLTDMENTLCFCAVLLLFAAMGVVGALIYCGRL